jgi:hypothetical protein
MIHAEASTVLYVVSFWSLCVSNHFFSRQLKSTYEVVQAIRGNSGWSWDDEEGAGITPEIQGTWNDYVERHPAAAPFRNAGWAHLAAFDSLGASSSANREANVFRPGSEESGPVDGSSANVGASADGQDDEPPAEEEDDSEDGDPPVSLSFFFQLYYR